MYSRSSTVAATLFAASMIAAPASAKVTRVLAGNAGDVRPVLNGPAVLLEGGAADVMPAFQAMIDEVRGCSGCATTVDVVILDAYGTNDYTLTVPLLGGVDSVESFTLTARADAYLPEVETAIRNAEVVFFDGGDQCDYVTRFLGTPVDAAVKSVYARGGAVGGVSAGMAIMGEYVFDACKKSITSADALRDPYSRNITFTYGFFRWNDLGRVLTDTHFSARDRMGRTMAFLARQIADGLTPSALGVAGDEGSATLVGANGVATVYGAPAYFVLADHAPEVCASRQPLTYSGYKIWKVTPGQSFDLRSRPTTGYQSVSVNAGVLSANPY